MDKKVRDEITRKGVGRSQIAAPACVPHMRQRFSWPVRTDAQRGRQNRLAVGAVRHAAEVRVQLPGFGALRLIPPRLRPEERHLLRRRAAGRDIGNAPALSSDWKSTPADTKPRGK